MTSQQQLYPVPRGHAITPVTFCNLQAKNAACVNHVKMNVFAGRQLRKRSGVIVYPEEQLQNKIVALYFSAGWCPPCRQFTPILNEFYQELRQQDLPFEIVFVPSDKTAEDMNKYMKDCHGDWLAVPFGHEIIKELKKRYHITAIPKVIVITDDGEAVTALGRKEVTENGPQCYKQWAHAVAVARGEVSTTITKASGQPFIGDL